MQSQAKNASKLYIPVLTIPQKELKLRKDAIYLYQFIDKSLIENLFFIDTIPLNKILSYTSTNKNVNDNNDEKEEKSCNANFKLSVHLMDHNNLSILLDPILGEYVNYIIDHHKDEG